MSAPGAGGQVAGLGGVIAQITGDDLLARLDKHAELLAQIKYTVDGTPAQIEGLRTQVATNAIRVGKLEQWRWFLTGIGTVVALLMTSGIIAALITATHR